MMAKAKKMAEEYSKPFIVDGFTFLKSHVA
jgi:hypothetical protein